MPSEMPPQLQQVIDLCNTAVLLHDIDVLSTLGSAHQWFIWNGWEPLHRDDELASLRSDRETIRAFLTDRADAHAREALNRRLSVHWDGVRIDETGQLALLPKATEPSLAAEAISAIVRHGLDPAGLRLKACAAESCRYIFWDGSRPRTRQWCDMNVCGARNKMRQFRSRDAAAAK